jgi:RNA polymerase sigma factor (sigma-70 family)
MRYSPMVFSIGLAVLKSREDAEDVVQDLFAHKLTGILEAHPGMNPEELGRMLSVVARNMCIDRYRRKRRFPETELDPEFGGSGTDTESDDDSTARELQGLMKELTPRYREVLTLKYLWDLTWEEVAVRLGMSHAGARKRADQAKKALAQRHSQRDAGKDGGQ